MLNATLKVLLGTVAVVFASALFITDAEAGRKGRASATTHKPFFMKVTPARRAAGGITSNSNAQNSGTQNEAPKKNKTFCGNGDQFTFWVQDENGNQVGETHHGCTD